MDKRGKFVVFEGGEGSGKDTQIARLKELYSSRDDIVFTREPGGTNIGEQIRGLLMSHNTSNMDVQGEMLLFLAARSQLIGEVIAPALNSGKHVICNRFGLSTIAYQIYGRNRQQYMDFLKSINRFVVGEYLPDMCILLNVTPSVGIARTKNRTGETTRFDAEEIAFHERVQEGYLAHISEFGSPAVIDADKPLEEVWGEVKKAVQSVIE
ncbi:MAG: Thymidylate kinase [Candidatus Kaiserbacteria bacterium]|nr:Thymidylate kinase [Candidatus Kaiserbacteria bacterium]